MVLKHQKREEDRMELMTTMSLFGINGIAKLSFYLQSVQPCLKIFL